MKQCPHCHASAVIEHERSRRGTRTQWVCLCCGAVIRQGAGVERWLWLIPKVRWERRRVGERRTEQERRSGQDRRSGQERRRTAWNHRAAPDRRSGRERRQLRDRRRPGTG
jgi:transcription initiation factor TFIIIB Brf1 subunit/transcription initiation factor TFIIB